MELQLGSMSPSSEYSGLVSKDDDVQIVTSILNQKASLHLPGAEALQKHQRATGPALTFCPPEPVSWQGLCRDSGRPRHP